MDEKLLSRLEALSTFGRENDGRETDRAKKMLNIAPDTGRLLWILTVATGARQVLEIGTSNALSTLWLADAVRITGGSVVTLERSPAKIEMAKKNLAEAGVEDRVRIREGLASDSLKALPGPFDLVFLDADRPQYLAYLDEIVPRLRRGGHLVTDNVVSHAAELAAFLDRVKSDPRLFSVTLPVGNGEELTYKL
ncbi:MAG TPA: O-methyltransferase [Polyangiaceae bacterium]|jgi:predicted O-methyltransferase YrrM